MKILNIKSLAIASIFVVGMSSCTDFLNRPAEDTYTTDGFYQNDAQCFQGVNALYNSPWYDFQRGFVKIGDGLSGNLYFGDTNPYQTFVLKSSDADLKNASASLWSVNAYCNTIIENINMKSGAAVTLTTKNTVIGEALTWKAMAYFYLVRCFGAVPIIHNNSAIISGGQSNSVYRNKIEDVYTYIVKDLTKAIELLPKSSQPGRIDKYSACGLLAKVYLTKSGYGLDGTRNAEDLANAAKYAKMVIDESGRTLMPVYSDIFRLKNNGTQSFVGEDLISWQWTIGSHWTCQNTEQSDLALTGFSEFADTWGTWVGPSIDLQKAFGEDASSLTRVNNDARRKATMMMQGDHYDYFWTDKGGFNYDWNNATATGLSYGIGTGANCVKHLVGDNADHVAGSGVGMQRMATALSTHLLRLADVYLVYAEAVLGNAASTSDASALSAFNAVRGRSVANYTSKTAITFDDIFNERRLELAGEGDFWYDFVRLSYYKPADAKARLAAQDRGSWGGLADYYKGTISKSQLTRVAGNVAASNVFFSIPFPDTDQSANPNLGKDPVPFDFSTISF
jgi:hypothetical protein